MSEQNLVGKAQAHMNRVHHHLGSSPFILWFLGLLTLTLWLAGTIVQIQTSEYLALGNDTRVAGVAWGILSQPWLMVTGQAPVQYVTAWLYGWVVEAVTLVYALALTAAIVKLASVNSWLAKGFVFFGVVLIALNAWADYSASPGTTALVQFLIAVAISLIVVCGLPLGIGLIERGFEEF